MSASLPQDISYLSVVKRHPEVGANIVGQLGFFGEAANIIKYHHSRFDGCETNSPPVGFIRAQCRLMIEDSVTIPENFEDLMKFIRNLPLPKASKMPTEKIVEYNKRAKEALVAA